MGNCQAIDTATLVIKHPNGKVERMYYPVSASQIMRTNPGHYVALLISSSLSSSQHNHHHVRLTRIKLLKPSDSLLLGHVYRLISSQEAMRGLWAKKQAKMKKSLSESERRSFDLKTISRINDIDDNNNNQERKREREEGRRRITSNGGRGRTWEPSLQSISEASS